MMDGKNPCEACKAKDKASGCSNCVLNTGYSSGECYNDKCMVNYECGCLMGLDDTCKASTCYQDDYRDHDCNECIYYGEGEDGFVFCECGGDLPHEIGRWDSVCENFKERNSE